MENPFTACPASRNSVLWAFSNGKKRQEKSILRHMAVK
ncbi:hypothetical protein LEP1GSC101_0218 [Leptospira borgpetersenii str. UI 09149]|nr:hypothetical protein LEP1GSC101_0218 [Leptospira borgpetersenii str. UI 09149]EMN15086.1 hypothetical protein LEP1GSC055_1196 [Leptospira borgpetersenii str. Brem 307]